MVRNIAQYTRVYLAVIEASRQAWYKLVDLYSEAEVMYPRMVGMGNAWHHILSKYLGGPASGLQARLPAPYHQFIANAIREIEAYGLGTRLQPDQWLKMLVDVHTRYPLPLLPGAWR